MTIDLTALESQDTHRFAVTVEPDGEFLLTLRASGLEAEKVWECRDAHAAERVALRQARALAERSGTPLTIVLTADEHERVFAVTASSTTELITAPESVEVPASKVGPEPEPLPATEEVTEGREHHEAIPAPNDDFPVAGARPTKPRLGAGSRLRSAAAALEEHTESQPSTGRKWLPGRKAPVETPPLALPKAPPIQQAADDLERPERRLRFRRPEAPTAAPSTKAEAVPRATQTAPPIRPQPNGTPVNHTPTGRVTFLPEHDPAAQPATRGWRGALNLMGTHLRPSASEVAYRDDEAAAATAWTGPRTIAVVNGKGSAGKTPTTAMLAAVFAHYGSSTLAWDNNPLRGTLGWRTEQAPHDATILDLLERAERLSGPETRAADLTAFLHHQRADRFDVLRSQPRRLASDQRLVGRDVDAVHRITSKFFRLIVMDSGNDESDPMWRAMIEHTDQLVVVTNTQAGTAEAGALLLDSLTDRGGHGANLARDAVAVVTQADRSVKPAAQRAIEDGYRELVAPERVVTIPYDPGMVEGALRLRELRTTTQRAWIAAAATVARAMPTVEKEETR